MSDIFAASQRALGMSMYALAPFLGPVFGPIIGGFIGEYTTWVSCLFKRDLRPALTLRRGQRWLFWAVGIVSPQILVND